MDEKFDVIVIGAGIIGASVATRLAEAGYSVLIIERNQIACGASGGNLGQISISDRCSEKWHMELSLKALNYYEEVLSVEYPQMEFDLSGGSLTLTGEEQIDGAKVAQQQMKEYGIDAEILYGKDICKKENSFAWDSADAILYCPIEGKLNPLLTTISMVERGKRLGVKVIEKAEVIGFENENGTITKVKTTVGDFSSKWVINCCGPRAGFVAKLLDLQLPICYHKGTAFVSQPMKKMINGPICTSGFFSDNEGVQPKRRIGFGTTQTADGSILIAQSTEISKINEKSVNMASLQLIAQSFLKHFPQLKELQIVRAWAAVTTYTKDSLPVFGFSKGINNYLTAAAFKGAFTVAPAIGEWVIDMLEGCDKEQFSMFSPDRAVEDGGIKYE